MAVDETHIASLPPGDDNQLEAPLPTILSVADEARYRRIFAFQDDGAWRQADREIDRLDDKLLLGDVLAQRYTDKRYHPSYDQLARWLAHYADEPDAKAIYALALPMQPVEAPAPTKPTAATGVRQGDDGDIPTPGAAASDRPAKISAKAPPRVEGEPPVDHWAAGLADWQANHLAAARRHFETLAESPGQSTWTRSAAAFWAARVALRSHRPEHVAYWLGIAAEKPRTFYGLIARRLLGVDTYLNFDADPFTEIDASILTGIDAGRRALALLALDQRRRASAELRFLASRSNLSLIETVEALADRANLPGLSLQLAAVLADADRRNHDYALYPVPRWQPHGGFSVDRALLFALMRQESLFLPRVKSSAGALGLMQLMPATARSMAERTGERLGDRPRSSAESEALADPEINLTLAQEYVQTLLSDFRIHGNLLLFASAYNCGPGVVAHWQAERPQFARDPLLFIETLPLQELRIFTKRVLTNYWIYRQRLGQPVPDLDALAAGDWPTYIALDGGSEQDTRHAAN